MKRLFPAALLSIAAASVSLPLIARAEDKAAAPKGDLARFQGAWSAKAGPDKNVPVTLTIKGTAVTLKISAPNGQDYESSGEIKLDEKAKPHRTVDWVKFTSPMGEAVPENLGLYEFVDKDTLKVCSGGPGNERPTEFKQGDGGPPQLLTLKREDKAASKE